ncbi:hypothetical protein EDEG_02343 [Edhazardia aedis USNM 41457]|uniref:Uncharacterized protein n=1 Tax=Edhazardia aedis (strain USNM 41457) TaxID=1003232 RepID=J9D707_EDHAE|nr:hypothetical protein EDEG_02343 [Edhazardia aedis USNM 41457]|eukprot:EJW03319.1 hypothetical protein EDEG_02343 [Edhazardia aedis USNM 41457]
MFIIFFYYDFYIYIVFLYVSILRRVYFPVVTISFWTLWIFLKNRVSTKKYLMFSFISFIINIFYFFYPYKIIIKKGLENRQRSRIIMLVSTLKKILSYLILIYTKTTWIIKHRTQFVHFVYEKYLQQRRIPTHKYKILHCSLNKSKKRVIYK